MSNYLDVEIVTPQKTLFSGKAISVTVPGAKSSFQILWNHAPIVSSLSKGKITLVDEKNNETVYETSSGFVELQKNKVSILVEAVQV